MKLVVKKMCSRFIPWTDELVLCSPIPPTILLPTTLSDTKYGASSFVWWYLNADKQALAAIARWDPPGKRKSIRPLTCWQTKQGELVWCWKKPPPPTRLFGLDELDARPNDPVLVVEGEKTAVAAREKLPEYVVITWMGGTGGVEHCDITPLLGRSLTFWPDHDEPGKNAMHKLIERISRCRK